ncbi:MAG: 7-carboxy-7-deazaguanine synthase QueE [Deltaproteobacteria bacterium GWC2_42_11]|nr:MAG: 7-carboxy-7-deazaguanine synthase QueE [Deltaproteobacteria bacterium GWC2_42_11]
MKISEIFFSIQGESSYAGLPCIFIRLAGCNLKCAYCDTAYAQDLDSGYDMSIDDILHEVKKFKCKMVEITGGEPLMQDKTVPLINKLLALKYKVLLETNGTISLKGIDKKIIKIMDIKTPGSGFQYSFIKDNLKYIRRDDEIKFVLVDRNDYEWAKALLKKYSLEGKAKLLFSAAHKRLSLDKLSEWILKDRLNVKLQPQLHKIIWGKKRGV